MQSSVLIIDDQESIRHFLERALAAGGHEVRSAADGASASSLFDAQAPDLVILDLRLPDTSGLELLARFKERVPEIPVIMMTAYAEVETAVQAMKRGAFDYLVKPVNLEQLRLVAAKALETARVWRELEHHRRVERERLTQNFVRGSSPAIRAVYEVVEKVARSDSTNVLITGESGTGKQIVAGLIHAQSGRAGKQFLEINCAAIPRELLESELFGHERGAFTDARSQKPGLLELASGGSLFLDEVGEMGANLQVKLLKVLESMTFRRVGGTRDIRVSVRLISATNQDLEAAVRQGTFREDLYYRLMVVPIHMPALRERREDIPLIGRHYLQLYSHTFGKRFRGFAPEAEARLQTYPWPGNIRELRNVIERTVLLEDGELVDARHLHLGTPSEASRAESLLDTLHRLLAEGAVDESGIDFEELLDRVERGLILRAVEAAGGNQSRAAELLHIKRDKLRYRMKHHQLEETNLAA
jgi:two-component system, NtrC family, response regulator AtoC